MNSDTIAAISTAMSSGGIGIIRISGEDAFSIIEQIFKFKIREKEYRISIHTLFIMEISMMEKNCWMR